MRAWSWLGSFRSLRRTSCLMRKVRPKEPARAIARVRAGLEDVDVECQFTVANARVHRAGIAVCGTPLAFRAHGLLAISRLFRPRVGLFYDGERRSVSVGCAGITMPSLNPPGTTAMHGVHAGLAWQTLEKRFARSGTIPGRTVRFRSRSVPRSPKRTGQGGASCDACASCGRYEATG